MKVRIFSLAIGLFILTLNIATSAENYSPTSFIVKLKPEVFFNFENDGDNYYCGLEEIDKLNQLNKVFSITTIGSGKFAQETKLYLFKLLDSSNIQSLITKYMESGYFQYVVPNFTYSICTTPNDKLYSQQWGLKNDGSINPNAVIGADINIEQAWDVTKGDTSTIVAIIDTGLKLDHPEFNGRIWTNYKEKNNKTDDDGNHFIDDFNGWNFVANNNDPTDDHGHGTNVTSIIGENGNNLVGFAGINWKCKLMPLKALGADGRGYDGYFIAAIGYAVDNGAKVINMSLAGDSLNQAMVDAVNYAYIHNVLIVAAMGNDYGKKTSYPAAIPRVMAVGAIKYDNIRADFSNYGPHISVCAPGYVIYGLDNNSNTNFTKAESGTSQACPHVAGLASLLFAKNPNQSIDQVRKIIEFTAVDQVGNPSEDTKGFDKFMGWGRIDAGAALNYDCAILAPTVNVIGNLDLCQGDSVIFELDNNYPSVKWSTGATSRKIIVKKADTIYAQISDGVACIANSAKFVVKVNPVTQVVLANYQPIIKICEGDSLMVRVNGIYSKYLWSNGATGKTAYFNKPGDYFVTVTMSGNKCTSTSKSFNLSFLPLPSKPTITALNGDTLTLRSSNAPFYQWFLNDSALIEEANQTIKVKLDGRYQVQVSDYSGCKNMSDPYPFFTNVNDMDKFSSEVQIIPNPNDGEFVVSIYNPNLNVLDLEILNNLGQLVYSNSTNQLNLHSQNINISNLASGVYYLKIKTLNSTIYKKIVKIF